MTEQELNKLQDNLDVAKYFESEKTDKDMSGKMNYCMLCPNCDGNSCKVPQWKREKYHICATIGRYTRNTKPYALKK